MKMLSTAMITLIAVAAFATEHGTTAAPTTGTPAATTAAPTKDTKMAKATPSKEECTKNPDMKGCKTETKEKKH